MKKVKTLCIMLLIGTFLTGCIYSSDDDMVDKASVGSQSHIEENDFKNIGFSDSGLFWTYQFDDMSIQTSFVQDNPQEYFIDRDMTTDDIKSLEVKPDLNKQNQWIYIIYKDGKFQVDEADLKAYGDKGRTEAYQRFNHKLKNTNLTIEDIGLFTVNYFNEIIRQDLIKIAQEKMQDLATNIQKAGYTIDRYNEQSVVISKEKQPFKIVISSKEAIVVSASMDLSSDKKTGYMYIPSQGTGGYMDNDQSTLIYRYNDNVLLGETPSTGQYTQMNQMKEWYDNFITQFETDTATLQRIQ